MDTKGSVLKMIRRLLALLMAGVIGCFLISCSQQNNDSIESAPIEPSSPEEVETPVETEENDYSSIIDIFSNIVTDSEVSASKQGSRLAVTIKTTLSSESAPDEWSAIIEALNISLESSTALKEECGVNTITVELYSSDETILASGYNNSVKYDIFAEKEPESDSNSSTISKFEYDQISVGMSLSEVKEIIGGSGVLQNQVGEPGQYGSAIMTYRWYGERENSYADILFDDYKVYSKVEFLLD